MDERAFWQSIRQALLMICRAIEKRYPSREETAEKSPKR